MVEVFVISGTIKVEVRVSVKKKAEADNTYQDLVETLHDYPGYHKSEFNNCFIMRCFKETE